MATQYQQLKKKLGVARGRKPLPAEERARRAQIRAVEQKRKNEARRRASFVLQTRYNDEFQDLFQEEMKALKSENKYATKK
jgi:hypothetical protein